MKTRFTTTAHGRVTILGDHQDYLGLKVIASPIKASLKFEWSVQKSTNSSMMIDSKPLRKATTFPFGDSLKGDEFDLARACIIALMNKGAIFNHQVKVTITGDLRPKSGLSSSAAFAIGFLKGLLKIAKFKKENFSRDWKFVPELAFEAEHEIMGVPCGQLDQYTCHSDHPLLLEFSDPIHITVLPIKFPLLIIDSLVPKSTEQVHVTIQEKIISALKKIDGNSDITRVKRLATARVIKQQKQLTSEELQVLMGVLKIRDCLDKISKNLLSLANVPEKKVEERLQELGQAMYIEHEILRKNLRISHPALDEIVEIARSEGALGAKLTGAGKGGAVVILLNPTIPDLKERLKSILVQRGFQPLPC